LQRKTWYDILQKIIDSEDFQSKIKEQGYYTSPKDYRTFRQYTQKVWTTISTSNTANFLSKDFWHEQPTILTNNGYYIIRTGEGSFAIFNENIFPSPYLKFNIENVIEISTEEPNGYDNLKTAFKENILENSALEQLRFNGGYKKIIANVLGQEKEYYVGVRGNTTRAFNVYFHRMDTNEKILIYEYKGQADIDYSLWTENSVFLFEAKKKERAKNIQSYINIGWHKFAYACARFKEYNNLNIYPVYFLRTIDKVLLFVFPRFSFYKDGIILNEVSHMIPQKIYSVSI
jgi:hypothetical protein